MHHTGDGLKSYKEFIENAIKMYESLPQETSELYKRHYINIPFDLKSFEANKDMATNGSALKSLGGEWIGKTGIKFDMALGSSDFLAQGNEFIRIEKAGDSVVGGGLHSNSEDKYIAYINAKAERYVIIDVPDGKSADINMLMLNSNRPLNAKIIIRAGKNAKLNLFEYYGSATDAPTSLATIHEIYSEEGSDIELNALHNEDRNTLGLSFCKNRTGENSHIRINSVYNGAAYTRARSTIEADKTRSRVDVTEVVFGSGPQRFDIETHIVNVAPYTNASLESKAALTDTSFCILKGFAKLKKGAEKARSYVHERGILLDKGAKIDGLPDMSVDENDVKATHSSATAPVDPESVFYLMSKGIDEIGVRRLLVTGFFASCLSKFHNDIMKGLSMSLINSKLQDKIYGAIPNMDMRNMWIGISDSADIDMFKGHYKYRKS